MFESHGCIVTPFDLPYYCTDGQLSYSGAGDVSRTVSVPLIDDGVDEYDETLLVYAYNSISSDDDPGTIQDDDLEPGEFQGQTRDSGLNVSPGSNSGNV